MAGAASDAVNVAVTNLTPTFWTTLTGSIALVGLVVRQWVPLRKQKAEADASLREDLMGMLHTQSQEHKAEVASLKADLSSERQHCAEVIEKLQVEIRSLRDQLTQLRISTGNIMQLPPNAPKAIEAMTHTLDFIEQRDKPKET